MPTRREPAAAVVKSAKRGFVAVDMGEGKEALEAHCVQRGMTVSQFVRSTLLAAISGAGEASEAGTKGRGSKPRGRASAPIEVGPSKRRELRLAPDEDRALAGLADASGHSFQSYVIALVRGHLAKKPQFGPHELRALHESNAHLVDLVQMMRKHQDPQMRELSASIDCHLKEVKAMTVRNGRRFA